MEKLDKGFMLSKEEKKVRKDNYNSFLTSTLQDRQAFAYFDYLNRNISKKVKIMEDWTYTRKKLKKNDDLSNLTSGMDLF